MTFITTATYTDVMTNWSVNTADNGYIFGNPEYIAEGHIHYPSYIAVNDYNGINLSSTVRVEPLVEWNN